MNKPKKNKTIIGDLMNERNKLKKKQSLNDEEEEKLIKMENMISEACEDENRKKVLDNFKEINGSNGNLSHQGVWKLKKKHFPKIKPTLPAGKNNLKNQLITNPEELKTLYLETFKYRLRHRPAKPDFVEILDLQEELFWLRLEMSKKKKTPAWTMEDLEDALKTLKTGKCRDPDGLIREIFKEEVIGEDLKRAILILFNRIKQTGIFPSFMQYANICAIYKGRGEVSSLDSDRGIFLVSLFRTIMMKMIYKEKYNIIDESISDSNIVARKHKNIRNHIFVVNSIILFSVERQSLRLTLWSKITNKCLIQNVCSNA